MLPLRPPTLFSSPHHSPSSLIRLFHFDHRTYPRGPVLTPDYPSSLFTSHSAHHLQLDHIATCLPNPSLEADGKAILNYHLTRAPVIKPTPLPAPSQAQRTPKLASLYFPKTSRRQGRPRPSRGHIPVADGPRCQVRCKARSIDQEERQERSLWPLTRTWPEARAWIEAEQAKSRRLRQSTAS